MLGFGKLGVGLLFRSLSHTYGTGKCVTGENTATTATFPTMTKLTRSLLIASLTLNALFLLGGAWVVRGKNVVSRLQLKFEERDSDSLDIYHILPADGNRLER